MIAQDLVANRTPDIASPTGNHIFETIPRAEALLMASYKTCSEP